jgi:hypothetical protein
VNGVIEVQQDAEIQYCKQKYKHEGLDLAGCEASYLQLLLYSEVVWQHLIPKYWLTIYQIKRRRKPKDLNLHIHCKENL